MVALSRSKWCLQACTRPASWRADHAPVNTSHGGWCPVSLRCSPNEKNQWRRGSARFETEKEKPLSSRLPRATDSGSLCLGEMRRYLRSCPAIRAGARSDSRRSGREGSGQPSLGLSCATLPWLPYPPYGAAALWRQAVRRQGCWGRSLRALGENPSPFSKLPRRPVTPQRGMRRPMGGAAHPSVPRARDGAGTHPGPQLPHRARQRLPCEPWVAGPSSTPVPATRGRPRLGP